MLDLSYPQVMGILNVTPDSFFDGGNFLTLSTALDRVAQMVDEGATIIDVGGESTRPQAPAVSLEQELERVIPVIEAIAPRFAVTISIDTSKAEVMRTAVAAGAGMINDVCALQQGEALTTAAALDVPICLMHMLGEPRTMQQNPIYQNVVVEVMAFLQQRVDCCLAVGIKRTNLIIDPGFGFGKTLAHNLVLLKQLQQLTALNLPVLVGVSRKSMFGALLDLDVTARIYASVAAATLAVSQGATIIRAHDVKATVDALAVVFAVTKCKE